ncbi:MAG: chloride channel protein [Candidatus Heimdallarchaeota archaeon]|nr:chloride channel protein [Candidatus Heimdallarchaeota archaeon]MDH5644981.1 chloride channel protein [Candidatus Heimdallarchaeota archaeon]
MKLTDNIPGLFSTNINETKEFEERLKQWIPVAMIIGIVIGIAMTIFFLFTHFIRYILSFFSPIISMLIGGLIIAFLVKTGFENPNENGINFVISKKHKGQQIPIRDATDFISAGIAIGSGLPVGREGPSLIIGSAIAGKITSFSEVKKGNMHQAITIGSAAATGALFQAPFGSAVFAAEVPYKEDIDAPLLLVSFISSVLSAITFKLITTYISDNYVKLHTSFFDVGPTKFDITPITTIQTILFGIVAGLLGKGFIWFFYKYKNLIFYKFGNVTKILIGLSVTISTITLGTIIFPDLLFVTKNESFSSVEEYLYNANYNILPVLLLVLLIQIVATTGVIAVGFPGGIFGPTLSIGAISGMMFAIAFGYSEFEEITAWAVIGMSAMHGATTKTPIASILLVLEITGLPPLIIPLIIVNIISHVVSGPESLYEGQLMGRDIRIIQQLQKYDQLDELEVKKIMTPKELVISFDGNCELTGIAKIITDAKKRTFPVIDDSNKVIGVISLSDVNLGIKEGKNCIYEVMTKDVIYLTSNISGKEAMYIMLDNDVERAPVIEFDGSLLGFLTMNDIIRAHKNNIMEYELEDIKN